MSYSFERPSSRELENPIGSDLPLQRDAVLGIARVVDDEQTYGVGYLLLERDLCTGIAGLVEITGVGGRDGERIEERQTIRVDQPADRLKEQRAAGSSRGERRGCVCVARQRAEPEEREQRDVAGGRIARDRRRHAIERAGQRDRHIDRA